MPNTNANPNPNPNPNPNLILTPKRRKREGYKWKLVFASLQSPCEVSFPVIAKTYSQLAASNCIYVAVLVCSLRVLFKPFFFAMTGKEA